MLMCCGLIGQHEQPKCNNIKEALRWLCEGAVAGDNLFMHYSGHGGSMKDDDGDEEDGMDETLVPVDYNTKGQIRDDDLFDLLVNRVPAECNLTVVMDCCHSGSILDLPYTLKVDSNTMEAIESGKIPSTKPNPNFTGRLLKVGIALLRGQMEGASIGELRKVAMRGLLNK
jgi:metacaspase-1